MNKKENLFEDIAKVGMVEDLYDGDDVLMFDCSRWETPCVSYDATIAEL